ncbi:uncharacterized protein BCR38DRAFT_100204 [Pseudomassariella vexata]|uniref:Uncharacterized protein n=1 Tax=Pseudomassariella vexata TaxID=1141098 RepID=A0A1Y2EEX0_9PEZI|nr:uncharacterized protein BCR38DRAFT_100204 [Pseudomassariella vexata]ORY70122.1 hypothetical protein BCR38DRAFT_100204 [Pseudomassariella vexata]
MNSCLFRSSKYLSAENRQGKVQVTGLGDDQTLGNLRNASIFACTEPRHVHFSFLCWFSSASDVARQFRQHHLTRSKEDDGVVAAGVGQLGHFTTSNQRRPVSLAHHVLKWAGTRMNATNKSARVNRAELIAKSCIRRRLSRAGKQKCSPVESAKQRG